MANVECNAERLLPRARAADDQLRDAPLLFGPTAANGLQALTCQRQIRSSGALPHARMRHFLGYAIRCWSPCEPRRVITAHAEVRSPTWREPTGRRSRFREMSGTSSTAGLSAATPD